MVTDSIHFNMLKLENVPAKQAALQRKRERLSESGEKKKIAKQARIKSCCIFITTTHPARQGHLF
jgi:hypothetical protein